MSERYIYETDEGETFLMCRTCVFRSDYCIGEWQCDVCHQWDHVSFPEGEMQIVRLYDRETDHA